MKKIVTTKNAIALLGVLVIVQCALLACLWHGQSVTNKQDQQQFAIMQQNATAVADAVSYQPVTVAPVEKKIYLPQLGLSLPLTALGMTLVYSADTAYVTGSHEVTPSGPLDEAAISTADTARMQQSQTQFDCSELVRVKFDVKANPNNPSERLVRSVTLANGKTLQIYAEHQRACHNEWSFVQVNPDVIAGLFKEAQSYTN